MDVGNTPHKVLIVDDSKADRRSYRRSLERDASRCYSILEAAYGEQGIALCQQERFDAILLDFQLPDMDGLHVLDVVKTQQPQTAVIMLTGHGSEQIAVQAMKRGAQDYLIKDQLPQDVLQRAVRNVINQTHLQQRLQATQQQQKVITQLALNIRQSLVLEETLNTTVAEVRNLLNCDRVLAYQFSADMSGTIIAESAQPNCQPTIGATIQDSYFQDQGAHDYCQGRIQRVDNIYNAGLNPCHLQLLEQFDVKAVLVTPILLYSNYVEAPQLWGLMVAHHCTGERCWHDDNVQLMQALSVHIAIAIQQAQLLETTQTALAQAKALNSFKSKILTTISHEYNSPLTAIHTAAETLRIHKNALSTEHRERYLSIIEQKAKHLSELVQDMLLANQAELDQLELHPETINLETVLSELMGEYQNMNAHNHQFALHINGDLNNFSGDLKLLKQVFDNLFTNAIKYSPEGGKINLVVAGRTDDIAITIQDHGIGIPPEDLPHLFRVFYRGSNVDHITGTGMGLNIVKTIIELHRGTVTITSASGQGTKVELALPKQLLHS